MPQLDENVERKVIDALKGYINTLRLTPSRDTAEPEGYQRTFRFFSSDDDDYRTLHVRRKEIVRILDLLERVYPEKTDPKLVDKLLLNAATEWIEAGHQMIDQAELEQLANQFIVDVASEIKDWVVYMPVEGIEGTCKQPLPLGTCSLHENKPGSELEQHISRLEEFWKINDPKIIDAFLKESSFFLKIHVAAHPGKAMKIARNEAELGLNVLRLFVASYVRDRFQRTIPRDMGLVGTVPGGEHSLVLYATADILPDEQYPGGKFEVRDSLAYEVDFEKLRRIHGDRLGRINARILSSREGRSDCVGRRLALAISWFGKGTSANSIVESFLMYAIAIEALLSQGRTSQHEYARRMAALVLRCRDDRNPFYPCGGTVSSQSLAKLLVQEDVGCRSDRLTKRIESLFKYRNAIAHGRKSEDELGAMELFDFETLVRCSLISFVDGGWRSLKEFTDWMKASL